ncbi:Chitin synthase [Rhizoctonia solani]|uniref:Chitin synthase n=1 Tax=Rhizoctonia solani TaxID=456999 RepID=A0A8H7I5E1_9AGAM|nr:Chitin synthase [Rhizoctonia solani]
MAYSKRYQQAPSSPYPHSPSTPRLGVDPFATPTPSYDELPTHAGSAVSPTYAPAYRAPSPTATHPLAPDMAYNQPYDNRAYSHDAHPEWDSRSAKSYQTYNSQAHLDPHNNKQYEMSQFSTVPALPYNPAPGIVDYPPQQPEYGANLRPSTVRHVELQQGNLVLDMPVPTAIVPEGCTAEEQTHMRYTAVTCDPDEFSSSKYSLRPYLMGRKTELFIVMTMYNEDEILFVKTMNAVIKNVAHLCGRSKSKTWGPEGWKKVVVCIVSDGRSKINQRTLKVIQLMGCYQDGIAKDEVAGKDVTAHIFEYTSTVVVSDSGEVAQGGVPIQLLFCLKEQNKKKLNSHRWFFNAFGPLIKPNVCILLDVGTKPTGTSIYELWKCFDRHPGVGGACGEYDLRRHGPKLFHPPKIPLAASQNFEYKMSNILDKPLESVFGYISVLPGAFSAYRYKALLGKPLEMYFKGETMHGGGSDGAGCSSKKEAWNTQIAEFISQRRRWLNGSFFAALHATTFQHRIWTSGQNFLRKIILQIEFWYNAVQMIFAWTSLANFYLAFFFLVSSATANADTDAFGFIAAGAGSKVFEVFLKIYIALLFVVLICSLGNRPQGSKATYAACIILFGICNLIALWCAGFTVYMALPHSASEWANVPARLFENRTFRDIVSTRIFTPKPYHMFTSFLQYLFWLPSYVNILMMYAMCNLHDLGWGTKGDNGSVKDLGGAKKVKGENGKVMAEVDLPTSKEDVDSLWAASRTALRNKPAETKEKRDAATKLMDADRNSRTNVVLVWMGTNAAMIIFFTSELFLDLTKKWADSSTGGVFNPYLSVLFYALAGLSAIRFVGSALYLLLRLVGL